MKKIFMLNKNIVHLIDDIFWIQNGNAGNNAYYTYCTYYINYINYDDYTCATYYNVQCIAGWLDSVGSRVVYELDYKKPILYVIPIDSILGKLPVVPVGDTGTIPHRLRNHFEGAPGDCREGSGDGCSMWFVNSWTLGWSRDM